MCGILACIGSVNNSVTSEQFSKALALLSHRGPDDAGYDEFCGNKLGHTRLSIQDLSDVAHQPMYSDKHDVAVIFNGEIYNFKEIRLELESLGVTFNTQSDTEVLLKAYVEYGIGCLSRFIGMFSIILVDSRPGSMCTYVVRDRLGIKPLYYFHKDGGFIFSSEVKSILSLAKQKFKLNKRSVSSYLSFRYSILDETFFEGIECLKPGTYIRIDEKGYKEQAYWSLADQVVGNPQDKGEQYYLDRLDELLTSSIKYRMISDVPFGAYLSGGVDSSLVTALMSSESDEPIKTYTIGFNESGYNEFEYADIVARQYQTKHKQIVLNSDGYFDTLSTLIKYKDAPLSVPNEVPLYLMSKELKKDITVVLSGEGADEIFGGYGRIFRSADDYRNQKALHSDEQTAEKYNKKYNGQLFEKEVDHFFYNYSYTKPEVKSQLLSKNFDWQSIDAQLIQRFADSFDEINSEDYLTKMMYTFETIHLQGLLYRVDTTTMAASVEARVPFVDHRLVEFAFSIPNKYKLKWNAELDEELAKAKISDDVSELHDTPKYILKKVSEKYLPDQVLYRKKMGFPVPLDKWLGGSFADTARKVLSDNENAAAEVIDVEFVLTLLEDPNLSNDHALAMKIWMVLNLFLFCSQYKTQLIR
ncbi:asparagine synthase (glutamine-hydrolyzing) [Motiliproteus sp. MSK22-1]|uniref:asparagine synthase (glutamine-hydrolyzing) n=1 Tax=Motiliproteus sp. MSK22-1 TaxID=1897630 RepID=UPI0009769F25|nr:asparagine synthase (glutamine-hydrolyzing) [Motiliproteus sp. MSK22-1]OMH25672.1 asparagine synthase (glutamine-hydrolyzing) [Motiliproteus sp. MSK22-1]